MPPADAETRSSSAERLVGTAERFSGRSTTRRAPLEALCAHATLPLVATT
jgi:hypothetical protein